MTTTDDFWTMTTSDDGEWLPDCSRMTWWQWTTTANDWLCERLRRILRVITVGEWRCHGKMRTTFANADCERERLFLVVQKSVNDSQKVCVVSVGVDGECERWLWTESCTKWENATVNYRGGWWFDIIIADVISLRIRIFWFAFWFISKENSKSCSRFVRANVIAWGGDLIEQLNQNLWKSFSRE
jgi:hypothetical protein